ncbi:MAG: LuxR C-terminal-related transcriptional regulator, partial [Myxococcales bacterium]|nr:LuxR C-terminal-related transcriptional regulator [Myxococcales bacterium]
EGTLRGKILAVLAVIAGIGTLITLEILEEPDMTLDEILWELIEPTLIVMTAAGVIYLMNRMNRQHKEQLTLIRDLEVARAEGAEWRADMRELLKGLGSAIDAQFDRWSLTPAEREVAMLLLKGLSHREIASLREASEATVRQQARSVYSKSDLSGRAALSAFFLEDLLLPVEQR